MTKARFEELQYLCFIDSTEQACGNANYDKLFKIYKILSIIVDNLSLDEAMIAFKGWLSFHQYMPRKPAKYEIKVWMATDSQNCYVCGHAFRLSQEGYQAHLHSLGYHVVMKRARPFLDKNRCLFRQFLVLAQMMSSGVILILRSLVWQMFAPPTRGALTEPINFILFISQVTLIAGGTTTFNFFFFWT